MQSIFERAELVCVLEEHSSIGGLYSSIALWVIENNHDMPQNSCIKILMINFIQRLARKMIRLEAKFTHDSLFSEIKKAFQSSTK